MKHNTHIYIASKAIEFLRDSVDNFPPKTRARMRLKAVELQRLLRYHQASVVEASWAPDDVLCDKSLFHTFKLFTADEFSNAEKYAAETHERDGKKYYRIKGGGGLPYKVDHLARIIADLGKLRAYDAVLFPPTTLSFRWDHCGNGHRPNKGDDFLHPFAVFDEIIEHHPRRARNRRIVDNGRKMRLD